MQYVPGMIILLFGLIRLIMAIWTSDPARKAAAFKSAAVNLVVGAIVIALFSTVLKRPTRNSTPEQPPSATNQTPTQP